jgi:uncharacterized Zn finger protein (UPF0148 family)
MLITCDEYGGPLERFEGESYCPSCFRVELLREVEAADEEPAVLNLVPPPEDFPPPAGDEPPF